MPVFQRPLLDVTGCDIPDLSFTGLEKAVLELMGSTAETFVNPIEGAMGEIQGAIGESLQKLGGEEFNIPFGGEGDTVGGFLSGKLDGLNSGIDEFRVHTDRLSGVSSVLDIGGGAYGPGGIQGEYPGLAGLHSLATQVNTLKNSLKDPLQAAKDHYSPIFNSLFGPGDDMIRSVQSLVDGDVSNFLTNFPFDQDTSGLVELGSKVSDLQSNITNLINDDNLAYEAALDFVLKKTVGFSVLSMLEQPCLGKKLFDKIAGGDLKGAVESAGEAGGL